MRKRITIDLNRVEGDVEFRLDVEDNIVRDSWCVGTMYRGYEQILVGRAPSDVLVIVPRICGICSTAQLYAGVQSTRRRLGYPAGSQWRTRSQPMSDGRGSDERRPANVCDVLPRLLPSRLSVSPALRENGDGL